LHCASTAACRLLLNFTPPAFLPPYILCCAVLACWMPLLYLRRHTAWIAAAAPGSLPAGHPYHLLLPFPLLGWFHILLLHHCCTACLRLPPAWVGCLPALCHCHASPYLRAVLLLTYAGFIYLLPPPAATSPAVPFHLPLLLTYTLYRACLPAAPFLAACSSCLRGSYAHLLPCVFLVAGWNGLDFSRTSAICPLPRLIASAYIAPASPPAQHRLPYNSTRAMPGLTLQHHCRLRSSGCRLLARTFAPPAIPLPFLPAGSGPAAVHACCPASYLPAATCLATSFCHNACM